MTLESVRTYRVPLEIIDQTEVALREAGADGHERFALWTGTADTEVFAVDHLYVPEQQGYRFDDGLCVHVEADALHELNVWLYRNEQLLGVQIHTHPQEAYHSETDDTYPIVTTLGGLSIVVPRFCQDGLLCDGFAIYRLDRRGWCHQSAQSAAALLAVA